ncbi:MAG: beta-ketoacyl-ACP synthase III [Verrucomicrobiota bacterium]|nr:beta-ketoacyl-ACP synthase III [Verrucomicrobiota bacterium]
MSAENMLHQNIRSAQIVGTGFYVPEKVLTNHDLTKIVETTDEWITTRTGIKERRIAHKDEMTSDMASKASLMAIKNAGLEPGDIDLIICATVTPDTVFPSTACWIQHKIGAKNAAVFDLQAACAGFIYGIETARNFIATGTYNNVLVIGADKLTSLLDWTDRNTCVLFGDGAAAIVMQPAKKGKRGVIKTTLAADGGYHDILNIPGGGCKMPISQELVDSRQHYIKMNGKETFKQAVTSMSQVAVDTLEKAGLKASDLAMVIPHQANNRIIDAVAQRLGVTDHRLIVNVHKYGNTSAASIGIALHEAVEEGRLKSGDLILMVAFGGGLTWGCTIIEW